jgi:hypothetical protein
MTGEMAMCTEGRPHDGGIGVHGDMTGRRVAVETGMTREMKAA